MCAIANCQDWRPFISSQGCPSNACVRKWCVKPQRHPKKFLFPQISWKSWELTLLIIHFPFDFSLCLRQRWIGEMEIFGAVIMSQSEAHRTLKHQLSGHRNSKMRNPRSSYSKWECEIFLFKCDLQLNGPWKNVFHCDFKHDGLQSLWWWCD